MEISRFLQFLKKKNLLWWIHERGFSKVCMNIIGNNYAVFSNITCIWRLCEIIIPAVLMWGNTVILLIINIFWSKLTLFWHRRHIFALLWHQNWRVDNNYDGCHCTIVNLTKNSGIKISKNLLMLLFGSDRVTYLKVQFFLTQFYKLYLWVETPCFQKESPVFIKILMLALSN